MILTPCHAFSIQQGKAAHEKDTSCFSQSSPERAIQEQILTVCHAFSIQDAKTAHANTFKCQPNRPLSA
eukprot:409160-Hanusia_phi.AAC.1